MGCNEEMYEPKYDGWVRDDYVKNNILYCIPMTAHALETEEEQDIRLSDQNSIIEEKLDGVRGILHFYQNGCRVFSRRISKKTNWFAENSDSLPQIRDIIIPELDGTVIDGEMLIPNRPFKDVSATLNCKWDKAIKRQLDIGEVVFHAFDILYYRGTCVESMSLMERKAVLANVFDILKKYGIECIKEVPYYRCGGILNPPEFGYEPLTPKQYYEKIVENGGEGVVIKDLDMTYEHKRSKAFLKIKKYYTRECILVGFGEPTKYYDGKFPNDKWCYWEYPNDVDSSSFADESASNLLQYGCTPVTKYYAMGWVGNMVFGVIVRDDEVSDLSKNKNTEIRNVSIDGLSCMVLVLGECSGFDDDTRSNLSINDIGRVIEVKCNEIFKDTGRMRHPRFLRFRDDKNANECTYSSYIEERYQ